MFFITDLSTKNKMLLDRVSYFYENQKYSLLEREKKDFLSVIPFQKILIFHICVFSENVQCFVGAFL